LELILEQETTIQNILKAGPLKGLDDVRSPVLGHSAIFSAKLKSLRRTDAPGLGVDDPFPFLFDGREMAVETNLSSYTIPARGGSLESDAQCCCGPFTFWLKPTSFHFVNPPIHKREGDALVSPRRNKRVGQIVDFSDDE